jgi:hypothetical protein
MIRDQAQTVAKYLDIPEGKFKASAVWIKNFKSRHGVRKDIWTGGQKIDRVVTGAPRDEDGDATSPSNPEFDAPSVVADNEPYDSDLEFPVESGDPPSYSKHQEQASISFKLRPAWPSHASTGCESASVSSARSIPGRDTGGLKRINFSDQSTSERHPLHSDTALHLDHMSHPTAPRVDSSNTTLSKREPYRGSRRDTTYDIPLRSFPQLPLHSSPISSEAADAIEKVIRYVDAQPPGSTPWGSTDRSAL